MFIGLDLGTSGVRGILCRAPGDGASVLAEAEAALPIAHPQPGHSEQDPAEWCRAAAQVLAELARALPGGAALQGIGLSGQMHGATLLDRDARVIAPAILWNDTRAAAQAARLDALPGQRDRSGNILFPGFTAPKLAWLAETAPALFDRVALVLLPKDYLGLWLTGTAVSEMSDAAGTGWLDTGARAWSEPLLAASGMAMSQMPPLVEGTGPRGGLRPALAAQLGLPAHVPVVAGGADNAAAACGAGALRQGDGFVSLGTSGVILAARDGYAPCAGRAVHTFCHAVPGAWYQMSVSLAATDSLNWLARVTGRSAAELVAEAGPALFQPGRVRFLPYLSGERTPHNDARLRGGFLNLDIADDRPTLTRAVLAGVGHALTDGLAALAAAGPLPDRFLALGGGARSDLWLRLLATLFDRPLDLPARGELGAALGAARLAICGVTGADPATVMTRPPIARTIPPDPDPGLRTAWAEAQAAFSATYPKLKEMP